MYRASKKIQKVNYDDEQPDEKKKQNRGKPPKLGETSLDIPDIWTNALNNKCLQLIAKLQLWGRHCCIHPAGKKGKNEQVKSIDKKRLDGEKEFYELAEKIADEDFQNHSQTKRCIVFFFRRPAEAQIETNLQQFKLDEQGKQLMEYVMCLLHYKFTSELAEILSPKQNEQQLTEQFLKRGQNLTMNEHTQVVQNAYIKFMLSEMIQGKIDPKQFKTKEDQQFHFEQFLEGIQAEKLVYDFIKEIRSILYDSNNEGHYDTEHQVLESNFNF